jgi:hypothetical protein
MEQQKTSIFINGDHEYDYVKDEQAKVTSHLLFYSNTEIWSSDIRETLAASIEDDGNGYTLSGNARPGKKGRIDYQYAQQLELLLRLADLEITNKYELSVESRIQL